MYATQKKLFYSSLDSTFRDLSILSWLFKGPMVVVKRAQLLLFVVSDSTFQKLREAQIHTVNCRQGMQVILENITKFRFIEKATKIWLDLPRVCSPSLNHRSDLASYVYI